MEKLVCIAPKGDMPGVWGHFDFILKESLIIINNESLRIHVFLARIPGYSRCADIPGLQFNQFLRCCLNRQVCAFKARYGANSSMNSIFIGFGKKRRVERENQGN